MNRAALEVFERIVAAPAADAWRLLDELCPPGSALREPVLLLLAFDAPSDPDGYPQGASERPGTVPAFPEIPGYRIEAVVGTGATSVVYRAWQEVPPRHVALKVLFGAGESPGARQRFEVEVASLACLNHPSIAQVHAAGAIETPLASGLFLTMELVLGGTLAEHCATHRSSVQRRVGLLADVADAIAYAHGRGVLHRDIKPTNILVDESGPTPRVKVLDFGIARLNRPGLADAEQAEAGFVGTLEYSAPERLAPGADDRATTDARTDVYSLGVVAYELLGGHPPLDLAGLSLVESVAAIHRLAPPRLSTLDRSLRGDLEHIVARAMHKDPSRRYATAAEFADDLRRHLANRPVRARPLGPLRRLVRWARRNRTFAALALTAGIAALTLGWSQLRGWRQARDQLVRFTAALRPALDRLEATTESFAARAAAIDGLLGAFQAMGDEPSDPELAQLLLQTLLARGDLYREAGDWSSALTARRRGLALAERLVAMVGDAECRRQRAIFTVLVGDAHLARGERQSAEEYWSRAHAQFLALADEMPSRTALDDLGCSYDRMARIAQERGDLARTAALLEQRFAVNERLLTLAPEDRHTLLALCDSHSLRAALLEQTGDVAEGLVERETAHRAAERLMLLHGEHRLSRRRWIESLGHLASNLNSQRRYEECANRVDGGKGTWLIDGDEDLERQAIARLHVERGRASFGLGDSARAATALRSATALLKRCAPSDRVFWSGGACDLGVRMLRATPGDAEVTAAATDALAVHLRSLLARPDADEALRVLRAEATVAGLLAEEGDEPGAGRDEPGSAWATRWLKTRASE